MPRGGRDTSRSRSTRASARSRSTSREGNNRAAAIIALSISHDYQSKLSKALESAWFKRAESLLDREPECIEHAHVARRRASNAARTASSTRRSTSRSTRSTSERATATRT